MRFNCPPEMTLITVNPLRPEAELSTARILSMGGMQEGRDGFVKRIYTFFIDNVPSPKALLVGGPLSFFWAYSCLFFAGYLKRKKDLRTGYTRKIFHFLVFTSVAIVPTFLATLIL
jgi:phytol kinase